ncbi:MAG: amino acid adenylation domain-containing protein [Armatimonadota bacterium]
MRPYLLPHLLTDAAERDPAHAAVTDARGSVPYADVEQRANRLANLLKDTGTRRGDRVGLYLTKSTDAIVGIYGILKAGAAYVPLDPLAPAARLAYIARDCGLTCLVTGAEQSREWPAMVSSGARLDRVIVLNAATADVAGALDGATVLGRDALEAAADHRVEPPGIDHDLAYILYTSGSTGRPKGVMLSHRNALAFVEWCGQYFAPTAADVLSNHAPLHFDLTILDIYVAALAGAELVIVPPEASVFPVQLARFIEAHKISIWYSVPSVLAMLALRGGLTVGRLPALRHIIFAGEVFPTRHLRLLMRLVPQARFTNLYGPTETNVCTYYRVPVLPDDQVEPIPIGKPIANVEVFVANDGGRVAADGEEGELYVRGSTVARGYWGDPERTERAFVPHPLGSPAERVYRTGDLVRRRADGELIFLGRRDHQIKSRGYRIELGDIEAALAGHPAVVECAVIPLPDELVGNRIKAFVVTNARGVGDGDLVKFLSGLLPKYMVPEAFEFVAMLPKTSTGKIDRTALAAVPVSAQDRS